MKTNKISSKLRKRFRELAEKLPAAQKVAWRKPGEIMRDSQGRILFEDVNHFNEIYNAYATGGQAAVTAYCLPYMNKKAQDDLKKDESLKYERPISQLHRMHLEYLQHKNK